MGHRPNAGQKKAGHGPNADHVGRIYYWQALLTWIHHCCATACHNAALWLFAMVLSCILLQCIISHFSEVLALRSCTSEHCIAQHCTTLHKIAQHSTELHWIALNSTEFHCIALNCTGLHNIALDCTSEQWIAYQSRARWWNAYPPISWSSCNLPISSSYHHHHIHHQSSYHHIATFS